MSKLSSPWQTNDLNAFSLFVSIMLPMPAMESSSLSPETFKCSNFVKRVVSISATFVTEPLVMPLKLPDFIAS